ncbi:MAG: glycosyltransferase [Lachnospiraceae bacterium]|jgi:glycosyltransferase involved in cell wall biosynthesis|nr:glycosyltransferase [Lachnospiraceae bacterium]
MLKISVVVPIYNVEKYVQKCIESIQSQSYQEIEIILVDDGSTDRCGCICDGYAKNDKRIKVIHKTNGGLVSARKAGIAMAEGDYVIAVDGDDWIEDDWIEGYVKYIKQYPCDMFYRDGVLRDTEGRCTDTAMHLDSELFLGEEIEDKLIPKFLDFDCGPIKKVKLNSVSWAYKRTLIQTQIINVDNRLKTGEDFALVTYGVMNAKSIFIIPGGGYHYVQREESMSSTPLPESLARLLEEQVLSFLKLMNAKDKTINIYKQMLKLNLICLNYRLLFDSASDALPLFPKVKKGSRIVIYGGGRVGRNIYEALKESPEYTIVAMVDQNADIYNNDNIQAVSAITKMDFDYVIIASIVSQNIKSMMDKLRMYSVDEQKIAIVE